MPGKKYSDGKDYKVIACVLSNFFDIDNWKIMRIGTERAKEQGVRVVFFSSLKDMNFDNVFSAGEKSMFDLMDVGGFDAIILFSELIKDNTVQEKFVARANAENVPVITVERPVRGEYARIKYDFVRAFEELCEHMIGRHGYNNVYFMGGPDGVNYADERKAVFLKTMKKYGLTVTDKQMYCGYFCEEPTRVEMMRMLKNIEEGAPFPDCIICANDVMAFTVIDCLTQAGLRVPEDIAVSGFDGIEVGKYCSPRLTTCDTNIETAARLITDIIMDLPAFKGRTLKMLSRFHIGRSCGCHMDKAENAGTKFIKLQSEVTDHLWYEHEASLLLTSTNGEADFNKAMLPMKQLLSYLHFNDFYFLASFPFVKKTDTGKWHMSVEDNNIIAPLLYPWHVSSTGECTAFFKETMDPHQLLPGLHDYFERGDNILIVPAHIGGTSVGYTAVTFDFDTFWATGYSTLVLSFLHMLEMQITQARLFRMYNKDSLTGLYNRNGFYDSIESLMDESPDKELCVISIDMDNLKTVNDTYGHSEGDRALFELSIIITQAIGEKKIAGRVGGDEFLVAFSGYDLEDTAKAIEKDFLKRIEDRNKQHGSAYDLSASIGHFSGKVNEHTFDYFLKPADDKMYEMKREHKKVK